MTGPFDIAFWIVNGFLAVIYFLLDHLATVLLVPAAAVFLWITPAAQRNWSLGVGALAILTSLAAPAPVPVFLVALALASAAALHLEHYNRPAAFWNVVRSIGLYSLAGLGYALWKGLGVTDTLQGDATLMQGATYLNAIIGIGMYVIPLGIVAVLAQSVFAHPPVGKPQDLIQQVRTRGKER